MFRRLVGGRILRNCLAIGMAAFAILLARSRGVDVGGHIGQASLERFRLIATCLIGGRGCRPSLRRIGLARRLGILPRLEGLAAEAEFRLPTGFQRLGIAAAALRRFVVGELFGLPILAPNLLGRRFGVRFPVVRFAVPAIVLLVTMRIASVRITVMGFPCLGLVPPAIAAATVIAPIAAVPITAMAVLAF